MVNLVGESSQPLSSEIRAAVGLVLGAAVAVGAGTAFMRIAAHAAPSATTAPIGAGTATRTYFFHAGLAAYAWPLFVLCLALFVLAALSLWRTRTAAAAAFVAAAGVVAMILLGSAIGIWEQANSCLGAGEICRVDLSATGDSAGRALILLGVGCVLCIFSVAWVVRERRGDRIGWMGW